MAGKPHPLNAREAEARRRNAQCSTGPRTEAGKRRVALNALRHGRYASPSLRPSPEAMSALGEDPQRFRELLFDTLDSYPPQNALQARVSEEIAVLLWQVERNQQAQEGKLARTVENLERDRHLRLKQIRAGTSYDAPQAEVLASGLRRVPTSPTKFPELNACLERLARRVRERDFSDETDLQALYGTSPTFLGAGIVNAFRALAQLPAHAAPDRTLASGLEAMIQEEISNVNEEYQFYCREYIDISRPMRQECRAPTHDRDYLLLQREEARLHRMLEQKIKLLMRMQSTGPARKARPRQQPWIGWVMDAPDDRILPAQAGAQRPTPAGARTRKDSGAQAVALSHKLAPVRAPARSAAEKEARRKEMNRVIREIYGIDLPPDSSPSRSETRLEPEAKEGEDKVFANKAKSDSHDSEQVTENTGEDGETNETQEI